jgi:hypothetical protein
MLAIRRAFGEVARRNRLNLYGEHGHGGERYSENELLHVNLRSFSNRHRWIRHGGLGLYSIVARQTACCNAPGAPPRLQVHRALAGEIRENPLDAVVVRRRQHRHTGREFRQLAGRRYGSRLPLQAGMDFVALVDVEVKNRGVARQVVIRELAAEAGLGNKR